MRDEAGDRPLTLRERSRQMAGREISDAALRLFVGQGFEATTIAQIAREAGVSQRTLFRYFGTKEDLIGGDEESLAAVLMNTVERQPAGVSAWDALHAGFSAVLAAGQPDKMIERMRLILGNPSLRARHIEKRQRWQAELVPVIEARMGVDVHGCDPRARAVVAAAFACADVAVETWVACDGQAEVSELFGQCAAVVRDGGGQ
jgi:AcrR family transcriptional regulator